MGEVVSFMLQATKNIGFCKKMGILVIYRSLKKILYPGFICSFIARALIKIMVQFDCFKLNN